MLGHLVMTCLYLICAEGHIGKNLGIYRYRRDEDVGGVIYAPCKDTYSQCTEWKKSGMCEMPQYKDYMPLVCTDTCGFCKRVQKARSEITAPRIIDATEDGVGDNNVEVKVIHKANIHRKLKSSSKPAKKEEVSKSDEGSGAPVEVDSKFFEGKPDHEQEEEKVESADKKTTIKIEDLDKLKTEKVKPEQTSNGDSVKKRKLDKEIVKKMFTAKTKVNKIRKQKEKKETAVKKEKVDKSQKKKEIAVKKTNVDDIQKSKEKAVRKENVDKVPKERRNTMKKENIKGVPKKREDVAKNENTSVTPKKTDVATKRIFITTKNEALVKKEQLTLKKKIRVILEEDSTMTPVKKSNKEPKPTIGMKSKISINFRKKDAICHDKYPQQTANTLEIATKRKTLIDSPKKQMILRESIYHKKISTKAKIVGKKESAVAKKESKLVKNKVNEFTAMKNDTSAKRSKKIVKKIQTTNKQKKHLEVKTESTVKKVPKRSKEPVKPKNRTSDYFKPSDIKATIADLSGARSGDIDILSGDSRSIVEPEEDDDDDDDDDDEVSETKEPRRQRENVQLHGDPEMVDLTSKERAEQPDFPDKDAAKSIKGSEKERDKKNVSDDEAEFDDIKIETLLSPKPEVPRERKKKE